VAVAVAWLSAAAAVVADPLTSLTFSFPFFDLAALAFLAGFFLESLARRQSA